MNRLDFLVGSQEPSGSESRESKPTRKPTSDTRHSSRRPSPTESILTDDEALILWAVALQFARYLLGNTTVRGLSAEDLAAEAICVICAQSEARYRKPAFARWVVHSRYVDQLRKLKSSMCYEEREEYRLKACVSSESRHPCDRLDRLRREIEYLSDPDRELIHLRFSEGMSTLAIANSLYISQRKVQKRIQEILRHLKNRLEC